MHGSQRASCSGLRAPSKRLSIRKKELMQPTCWPWGFHIPFPAALASFSISFFLLSSSVGSRLISFNFAQPLFSNSEVRSTPATSAWPRSRGISSLEGREWIDVKDISLPTVSVRRNSRDSKAQGCRSWTFISDHWPQFIEGWWAHLVLSRRCTKTRGCQVSKMKHTGICLLNKCWGCNI